MSKWSLLKSSIVERKRDCDSSSSIHRFNGYDLIQKRKFPWVGFAVNFAVQGAHITSDYILSECELFMEMVDAAECLACVHIDQDNERKLVKTLLAHPTVRKDSIEKTCASFYIKRASVYTLSLQRCDYWRYSFNCTACTFESAAQSNSLQVHTREKPRDSGLNARGLLSNKLHNVDNTGNVRVWPAEPLLLHTLLNVPRFSQLIRGKRVLEIGGGMSALAGLGLAVAKVCSSVVVTDGHPDCVKNQTVCIEMCNQQQLRSSALKHDQLASLDAAHRLRVSAQLLHWSPSENAAQVAALTCDHTQLFDVVIASDCLFFKDFHADLVHTLNQVLIPGGVGVFLQPHRDRTLQRFVDVCAETQAFATSIIEDYSPEVSALRSGYLDDQEALGYVEDIHYPVMLILTKN